LAPRPRQRHGAGTSDVTEALPAWKFRHARWFGGRYVRWRADAVTSRPHIGRSRFSAEAALAAGRGARRFAPFASLSSGARMNRHQWAIVLVAATASTVAVATDREDYNQRSAARFQRMFALADVNQDRRVTREEADGTIELVARFDDIDDNRDGTITASELERFFAASYR
jgi:hypothetical protein